MILQMYQILEFPNFFEKVKNKKISFKTSYKLAMLAREIEPHHNFYTEQFSKIIVDYSKKDSNGNPVPTPDGQGVVLQDGLTDECYSKVNDLRNLEVPLSDTTFSIEDFANLELSPLEVNAIIPFIKE